MLYSGHLSWKCWCCYSFRAGQNTVFQTWLLFDGEPLLSPFVSAALSAMGKKLLFYGCWDLVKGAWATCQITWYFSKCGTTSLEGMLMLHLKIFGSIDYRRSRGIYIHKARESLSMKIWHFSKPQYFHQAALTFIAVQAGFNKYTKATFQWIANKKSKCKHSVTFGLSKLQTTIFLLEWISPAGSPEVLFPKTLGQKGKGWGKWIRTQMALWVMHTKTRCTHSTFLTWKEVVLGVGGGRQNRLEKHKSFSNWRL